MSEAIEATFLAKSARSSGVIASILARRAASDVSPTTSFALRVSSSLMALPWATVSSPFLTKPSMTSWDFSAVVATAPTLARKTLRKPSVISKSAMMSPFRSGTSPSRGRDALCSTPHQLVGCAGSPKFGGRPMPHPRSMCPSSPTVSATATAPASQSSATSHVRA